MGILKLKTKDNKAIKIDDIILNVPENLRKFVTGLKVGDKVDYNYEIKDNKKYLKFIQSADKVPPKINSNILEQYKKYNWSLLPIANNEKIPIELNWSKLYEGKGITHYDIEEWKDWLKNGFMGQKEGKSFLYNKINLAKRTGKVSGTTVIDVDATKLTIDVDLSKTLHQKTRGDHYHLVYLYDPELNVLKGNKKLHEELKIDIRNDGNQVLVEPSIIDGKSYKWVNLGQEITPIPPKLKEQLMSYANKNKSDIKVEIPDIEIPKVQVGTRSDTLMSLGGMLRDRFSVENTAYILNLIRIKLCEENPNSPLTEKEIYRMVQSLAGYKESDKDSLKDLIYNWAKMYENDFTARDLMESLGLPKRGIVDKVLSELVKEDKLIRLYRGVYRYKEKIEWNIGIPEKRSEIDIKIPYFNHIQTFESGDIILIGGFTNIGKTTIAINIMKQLIEQGITPHYLYTESSSRFIKVADKLGINGKYKYKHRSNPLTVQLEPNAFTIIDWLNIEDKSLTDKAFKVLSDEMATKGGLLWIFQQLKKFEKGQKGKEEIKYQWFAPNMAEQYPSLSAMYFYDNPDGSAGHFQLTKIKEPKGENLITVVPCKYDKKTKLFLLKEEE